MNPFVTPDSSAAGDSITGSSTINTPMASSAAIRDSTTTSMSGTQPTLRDFPHPPSKDTLRVGRPPRAVAWSDKRSIISSKEKYTFYREGTPPPPEDRIAPPPVISEEAPYDYKYDHIAPPAPIPVATICGVRRRIFWSILAAVLLVVILAVGIGVGVGVGAKHSSSNSTEDPQANASGEPVTTSTVTGTFLNSQTTAFSSSEPTTAVTKTSQSTEASTISSNPAITTLVSCPAANNTIFKVPGTKTEFVRICGVDYTGKNSAVDLAHVWTPTFEDCMVYCAGYDDCQGCGWGILEDDPGSYHRCWLKGSLKSSRTARLGWDFAIMK